METPITYSDGLLEVLGQFEVLRGMLLQQGFKPTMWLVGYRQYGVLLRAAGILREDTGPLTHFAGMKLLVVPVEDCNQLAVAPPELPSARGIPQL